MRVTRPVGPLHRHSATVGDGNGRLFAVDVHGRRRAAGEWEGWLEFVPADGGAPLETDVETTQVTRDALLFWATGLAATYLEGALARARPRVIPDPRA